MLIFVFFHLQASEPVNTNNSSNSQDNACKKSYGIFLEGTKAKSNHEVEDWIYKQSLRYTEAYAGLTDHSSFVLPNRKPKIFIETDNTAYNEFREEFNRMDKNQLCKPETFDKIAELMYGKVEEKPFTNDLQQSLRKNIPKNVDFSQFYNLKKRDSDILDSSLSVVKDLKSTLKKCAHSRKKDIVVTINLDDHGSKDCSFIYNGKKLKSKQIYETLVSPLRKKGVKVLLNINSCYSGCHKDVMTKLAAKEKGRGLGSFCLFTQTRSDTVGYSSDMMISDTFDVNYPHYLKQFKNPLKAQICASSIDLFNEPLIATPGVSRSAISQSSTATEDHRSIDEIVNSIGNSINEENLAQKCKNNRIQLQNTMNFDHLKTAIQCAYDSQKIVKGSKTAFDGLFSHILFSDSTPGRDALLQIEKQMKGSKSIDKNCNIDLSSYVGYSPHRSSSTSGGVPRSGRLMNR